MDEIVFTNRKKRRLKSMANYLLNNHESSNSATSHCNHLYKCESSSRVVRILVPPPQFKLTAPPNPLNYVHINQIYEDASHTQASFDANFNNEKFLLYYLNLNNTKNVANEQDNYQLLVESNKDKCINYKIQVASLNLSRFASNHTEKLTNREDTKTILMSNLNTGFSLKKQQEQLGPVDSFGTIRNNNTNLFDSNLIRIGGSSSNTTSNPNELTNMFNIFLFTCLSFITLSFVILLLYLFISRKRKMRSKKQRNCNGLSINSTFMSNNSNNQGNNNHHLNHHPNFVLNHNINRHEEDEEDENAEQYHNLIESKPEFNFYNMKSCLDNGYMSVNTELIPNTILNDNIISTFNRKTLKHLASNEESNKLALIKPFMESAIACNCTSALSSNSSASESSSSNPSVLVQKLLPNTNSSSSSFSYTLSRATNGNKLEKVNPIMTSGQFDTHYQKLFRSNTTCSNVNHPLIGANVNKNDSILVYNNLNEQQHQLNSNCMSHTATGIMTNSVNLPNCCMNNVTLNKTAALIYNDLTHVPQLIQIVNLEDACHNQVLLANDSSGTGKFYECIQLVNFLNNSANVPSQPMNKTIKNTNNSNEDEQFYELIDDVQTSASPITSNTSTAAETNKNAHLNKSSLSSSSSASLMRKKYPRTNPNYSIKTSTLRKY